MPPYNSGLFDACGHALLERLALFDAVLAELIDGLSRRAVGSERRWINYCNLSVQQLGSIYEHLWNTGWSATALVKSRSALPFLPARVAAVTYNSR